MEKDENNTFDVVIVGGGVTGLIVGTALQRKGFSTVIIEKLPQVGGKCSELNWRGVRFDHGGKWNTVYGSINPEDGSLFQACKLADVELKQKEIHWRMGLLKKGLTAPEYHSINDWTGGKAMIEFTRAMVGLELNDAQKEELFITLEKMQSYSYQDLQKMTKMTLKQWTDKNIKDELVKSMFSLSNIVTDIPPEEYSAAHAIWTMKNLTLGKSVYGTLTNGFDIRDALVKPLLLSALKHGAEVILNHAVKQLIIKNNKIEGVWIYDNETFLLRKVKAKYVVINVPVYDAYPSLLKDTMLTDDELKYINHVKETNTGDLSCYFLLEKDTLKDLPGHFHAFDVSRSVPTYIGEICKQAEFGAIVPEGFDYLQIYIPGGRAGGYLKYKEKPHELPYEKLENAKEKMLKVVDKYMIPGFKDKIIHESITWSPNFGRYCQMAFETNLEVKSELIQGLYFASDSVDCKCIGNLGLDKCGEVSIKCINKIIEDAKIEQTVPNLS